MAFNGIIDAITSPTLGPDGTAKTASDFAAGLRSDLATAKNTVVEKSTIVIEQAKDNMREPLQNILEGAARIIKKAVPTALAACASLQYTGGRASFASYLQPIHLRSKYIVLGQDRHDRIGYPLEHYRVLNTLSGFVQCDNVRIEIPATATKSGATLEEAQLIKQYLEAGCYIE